MIEMNVTLFYLLGWILLFALIGFGATWLWRKWYFSRHSEPTKKRASRVFQRFGSFRGWKTFENVTLGQGAKAVLVDQLVIAPFGVIVACDLHQKGNVYGELESERWVLTDGEEGKETKREYIDSPYHNARKAVEQLRLLFVANKVYSVPVEVLVPKTMRQHSYITGSGEYLFDVHSLKAHLSKSRYEKDSGVKVAQVAALLEPK